MAKQQHLARMHAPPALVLLAIALCMVDITLGQVGARLAAQPGLGVAVSEESCACPGFGRTPCPKRQPGLAWARRLAEGGARLPWVVFEEMRGV